MKMPEKFFITKLIYAEHFLLYPVNQTTTVTGESVNFFEA